MLSPGSAWRRLSYQLLDNLSLARLSPMSTGALDHAFACSNYALKINRHSLQIANNDVVSADGLLLLNGVYLGVGDLSCKLIFLNSGQTDLLAQFG